MMKKIILRSKRVVCSSPSAELAGKYNKLDLNIHSIKPDLHLLLTKSR